MARCQGGCDGKLGSQGDWVVCGQCKGKLCYDCAGIKHTTWSKMNEEKKNDWKCKQKCRMQAKAQTSQNQAEANVDEEISKEEDEEEEIQRNKLKENDESEGIRRIEKKLDILMQKFDEQSRKWEEAQETIELLFKEQKDLKKENEEIKTRLKQMEEKVQNFENIEEKNLAVEKRMNILHKEMKEKEQYERNKNLEINQLDWMENEDLTKVIEDLAKNFNVSFQSTEIEKAHRIPNRNKNKPSSVIIQFKFRESRDRWLKEKRRIVTNDNMYRNGNRQRIFINENMTPFTKTLFWKTKMWAKEKKYAFVWFRNGKIMMRKNKDDKEVKIIHEEEDLNS